ncbi:MAG TPA: LCP family protein [Mycobacterium sp.]|nr:LCP family protein [Mycobacterium sp.]
MSDGDNATRGHQAASNTDRDGSPTSAAPWERWKTPSRQGSAPLPAAEGGAPRRAESGRRGNPDAAGAITVAELIARMSAGDSGAAPDRQPVPAADARPRTSAVTAPEAPPRTSIVVAPDVWPSEDVAELAYASELPDLDRIHRPNPRTGLRSRSAQTQPVKPAHADRPARRTPGPARPASVRRRALLAGRAVAALMAACALLLTGGAWKWSASKNNSFNRVSALDLNSQDIVDPGGQYGDENFLIVGADTRTGANSNVGAGDTDDVEGARSDTIMLVNIPANRKRVVVVSFPRDLAITPLYCEAWNSDTGVYGPVYDANSDTYSDEWRYTATKLNSAYSLGGPKCLVKEIQKLSGLSINRFMAVDFVGFARMVDALGGVEVCATTPLYDYELGTVLDQSGRQVINGSTALNYVRARSVPSEGNGDYGRIKRQQMFLSSLLRSLISSDTFFSPTKLNNVVNTFISDSYVDNVQTKDLVSLGQSLKGMAAGHITFVTVPTGETDENGDEPPRMADVRALFDAIINDDPLPGENDQNATSTPTTSAASAATTSTEATKTTTAQPSTVAQSRVTQVKAVTTTPGNVTVRVSNATGELGLAGNASDKLMQLGFNVDTPDDYPGMLKSTTVFFAPGNEQAAATVASALGNVPIHRVSGMSSMVRVVLGSDFRTVGKPAPSGSTVSLELNRGSATTPTALPDDLTVTNAADTTCG